MKFIKRAIVKYKINNFIKFIDRFLKKNSAFAILIQSNKIIFQNQTVEFFVKNKIYSKESIYANELFNLITNSYQIDNILSIISEKGFFADIINKECDKNQIFAICEPINISEENIYYMYMYKKYDIEQYKSENLILLNKIFASENFIDSLIQSHIQYANEQIETIKEMTAKFRINNNNMLVMQIAIFDLLSFLDIAEEIFYNKTVDLYCKNTSAIQDEIYKTRENLSNTYLKLNSKFNLKDIFNKYKVIS